MPLAIPGTHDLRCGSWFSSRTQRGRFCSPRAIRNTASALVPWFPGHKTCLVSRVRAWVDVEAGGSTRRRSRFPSRNPWGAASARGLMFDKQVLRRAVVVPTRAPLHQVGAWTSPRRARVPLHNRRATADATPTQRMHSNGHARAGTGRAQ